ncbi:topoisomerase DNA-binding C4 zinc finger domain-containing protein [Paenibacillus ferrarius]
MAENKSKIAKDECPKCGGNLVERSGKYGKFKGCGNYPKCRFVVKNA